MQTYIETLVAYHNAQAAYHAAQAELLKTQPLSASSSAPEEVDVLSPSPVTTMPASSGSKPRAPRAPVNPQVALVKEFWSKLPKEFSEASRLVLETVAKGKPVSSVKHLCASTQAYGSALGRLIQLGYILEMEEPDMFELNIDALRARIAG